MNTLKALLLTIAIATLSLNTQLVNAQGEKKNILVPAKIVDGKVMPYVMLNAVDITASGNKIESTSGYELPVVTIVAAKIENDLLPAVKYNGHFIAMKQLPSIEILAERKKASLASLFNFRGLIKKINLF